MGDVLKLVYRGHCDLFTQGFFLFPAGSGVKWCVTVSSTLICEGSLIQIKVRKGIF